MEKKSSLSTLLFAGALLIFVCATFAMFGRVVTTSTSANMFEAAFGTGEANGIRTQGLTTVFVFQMIIVAGVIAIIAGTVTRKFHYILTIVIYGIVCLCSFITFIISFNSFAFYAPAHSIGSYDASLGAGPIIYSVMHIIGLVLSASGLVFSRRGA